MRRAVSIRRTAAGLLLAAAVTRASAEAAGLAPVALIPVTSQEIDIGDDPETRYSGAPRLDWAFFGGTMHPIAKYAHAMPAHRHRLGIDYCFYLHELDDFTYPPVWYVKDSLEDLPPVPTLLFARVGKSNCTAEDNERTRAYDRSAIERLLGHYPHALLGGGQVAEVDGIFNWQYKQYYGRLPAGAGGAVFPTAYYDFLEANLRRSPAPYLSQQHNDAWGTHYVARERLMSLGSAQLFYRHNQVIVPSLVTLRSAARACPFPYYVQFSGQLNLIVSNEQAVVEDGARPVYALKVGRLGSNYEKSYALCRQVLYLAWLNGARFFNWETGELIGHKKETMIPSPLGTFTARAARLIGDFGPAGPVQTPIALVSEYSNVWRKPTTEGDRRIRFTILGDAAYAPGDYQMHGIRDLFFPRYLQSEMIYANTMGEDEALCATPYGESVDFLLSDVRQEALSRYGLVVWTGVPPLAPSMVREKLERYRAAHGGRVVLFGAVARRLYPEWFAPDGPERIGPGAEVAYRGSTFAETADFMLERLGAEAGAGRPGLRVVATVNGKPLVVEGPGGLVLALSSYGVNGTPSLNPDAARWSPGALITEIPHTLLHHARRLLDDEARRQTLFSVGNEKLHYVVTRPKDGEYVLGLFNDSMRSEPFTITSNIGALRSLSEVELKDNKDELKAVANGAAYAPPGLRQSPGLPLDYGLSDAAHIEGRDFRLFRIRVDERGVRPIPAIKYPERPAGRVLAVPGLEDIRRDIQGLSMFFSWFDGVKVSAGSLLALEDGWLEEQGRYLDRRGVRVVADGTGLDDAQAGLAVAKLRVLKKAPKDLILAAPSAALQAAAQGAGVRLVEPGAVNRLAKPGDRFRKDATLNIVDLFYNTEENLYCDLARFAGGDRGGSRGRSPSMSPSLPEPMEGETPASRGDRRALRGRRDPTGLYPAPKAAGDTSHDFFYAGPHISDLTALLSRYRDDFGTFAGIKIDSTYLLSKNLAALTRDRTTLTKAGLKSIVDLRRDQMHFDRITFYPHMPNYQAGVALYGQIVEKMKALGAADLIVQIYDSGEMRGKAVYAEQRDRTWRAFAEAAAQQGVSLHLVCSPGLAFTPAAAFDRPNVFVISGAKGKPSPYRLALASGSTDEPAARLPPRINEGVTFNAQRSTLNVQVTGKGPVTIHDTGWGVDARQP